MIFLFPVRKPAPVFYRINDQKLKIMIKIFAAFPLFFCIFLNACSGDTETVPLFKNPSVTPETYRYMALGDSYTVGESVCNSCNFPQQLKSKLETAIPGSTIDLQMIATTGWTTSNLRTAIGTANPTPNFDLVTLLIGVNNQYQHKPFSLYEQEFPELLNTAIALAKGDKTHVIVVSIPDYAYMPFGHGSATISSEIEQYNAFAKNYTEAQGVTFVNITDITRQGLENPDLVADDGLHPSELAYAKFVERLLPLAKQIIAP
jgi:acyl-CoA thioesterase-1